MHGFLDPLINLKKVGEIGTPRFVLRPLCIEDASEQYSSWFETAEAKRYIAGSQVCHDVASLRTYIAEKHAATDVLFLGIFERSNGAHIGNIKYEPIDIRKAYAIMGILIGEPAWRGRGVAAEVIEASSYWLRDNLGIHEIYLGVDRSHVAAHRAYEKAGFVEVETDLMRGDPGKVLKLVFRMPKA